MPWGEELASGVLPLMVVVQVTNGKVNSVDFQVLNTYVECQAMMSVTYVVRPYMTGDG